MHQPTRTDSHLWTSRTGVLPALAGSKSKAAKAAYVHMKGIDGFLTFCPLQLIPISLKHIHLVTLVQEAEKLLLPLVSTSHSRGGHAERVAMLQVFSAALKSADQLRGEKGCWDSSSYICSISFAFEMFGVKRLRHLTLEHLGGTFDLVGDIWLYISHWPCISCLAVLCQVLALAPAAPGLITPWTSFDYIILLTLCHIPLCAGMCWDVLGLP